MEDFNPDNEGNKVYETEPGVDEEVAGFSAKAQKDKFLGGSLENNNEQEPEKVSLAEKTLSFFGRLREKHLGATTVAIFGTPATIGQFLANGPEAGMIATGLMVGTAVALEKIERNNVKRNERRAKRRSQMDDRT